MKNNLKKFLDCYAGSDFLCQNHRCIQSQLNCDGFDHCGDNSDEPSTCLRGKLFLIVTKICESD